jgi:hypothetical protein
MPDLGNPKDRWLPFIVGCCLLALMVYVFFRRDEANSALLMVGTGFMAFIAGALFMLAFHREQ